MTEIQKKLFEHQDLKYRDFQAKLMPEIDIKNIIGVRNPDVKKVTKELLRNSNLDNFTNELPHKYYEENNVHSYIICECKEYKKVIKLLDEFLPYVDNWATCDIITPQIFKKNTDDLLTQINKWISSGKTYSIRFAIKTLMGFYLDNCFKKEYLEIPSKVISDEYYVKMMIAWFYATALAKQYDATIPYLEKKKLDKWVHNKTIQKAIESYRVSDEHKEYLRTLKIK
jgi:3-methyladenine DNA glycosylase AlkD